MKQLKKFLVVCLSITLVFALTACGGGGESGGEEEAAATPAEVIEQAMTNLEGVESYNLVMDMDMGMSMDGESIMTETVAEGSYIADPMKMSLNMHMDMGELYGAADMLMYMDYDGTNATTYMSADGGTSWMKQTVEGVGDFEQYDAEASLGLYVDNADSFAEAGTETINGSEATRYDGLIGEDALKEVLDTSGMDEQLAGLNLSPEDMASFFEGIGDIPISIWVDKAELIPVKYEMDMTQMMQIMMDNMMSAMGEEAAGVALTVDVMAISMEMSDYNSVENFEIPEAAKNAAEMTY